MGRAFIDQTLAIGGRQQHTLQITCGYAQDNYPQNDKLVRCTPERTHICEYKLKQKTEPHYITPL